MINVGSIFVDLEARLGNVYTALDGLTKRLDALSNREISLQVSLDDRSTNNLERLANSVDSLVMKIEKAQKVVLTFFDALDGSMGNLAESWGETTGKIRKDLSAAEAGVSNAFERMTRAVFNFAKPKNTSTIVFFALAFKQLRDSGWDFRRAFGLGAGGASILDKAATGFAALRNMLANGGIVSTLKQIGALGLKFAPKLLGSAALASTLLTALRSGLALTQRFLMRIPTSPVLQFAQLLKVLTTGLFRLEIRAQLFFEKFRFIGAAALGATLALSKFKFGLTGIFAWGGLAVTGLELLVSGFRSLGIVAGEAFLRARAAFGDGRAQFQLLLIAFRRLFPLIEAISRAASPLARMIKGLASGGAKKVIGAIVEWFHDLLASVRSIEQAVKELTRTLKNDLLRALQGVLTVTDDIEKKSGGPRGGAGGKFDKLRKKVKDANIDPADLLLKPGDVLEALGARAVNATAVAKTAARSVGSVLMRIVKGSVFGAVLIRFLVGLTFGKPTEFTIPLVAAIFRGLTMLPEKLNAMLTPLFGAAVAIPGGGMGIVTLLSAGVGKIFSTAMLLWPLGLKGVVFGALFIGIKRAVLDPLFKVFTKAAKSGVKTALEAIKEVAKTGLSEFFSSVTAGASEKISKAFSALKLNKAARVLYGAGMAAAGVFNTALAIGFSMFGARGRAAAAVQRAITNFNKSSLGPFLRNSLRATVGGAIAGMFDLTGVTAKLITGAALKGASLLLRLSGAFYSRFIRNPVLGQQGAFIKSERFGSDRVSRFASRFDLIPSGAQGFSGILSRMFPALSGFFKKLANTQEPTRVGTPSEAANRRLRQLELVKALGAANKELNEMTKAAEAAKLAMEGIAASDAALQPLRSLEGVVTDLLGRLTRLGDAVDPMANASEVAAQKFDSLIRRLQSVEGKSGGSATTRRRDVIREIEKLAASFALTRTQITQGVTDTSATVDQLQQEISQLTKSVPELAPVLDNLKEAGLALSAAMQESAGNMQDVQEAAETLLQVYMKAKTGKENPLREFEKLRPGAIAGAPQKLSKAVEQLRQAVIVIRTSFDNFSTAGGADLFSHLNSETMRLTDAMIAAVQQLENAVNSGVFGFDLVRSRTADFEQALTFFVGLGGEEQQRMASDKVGKLTRARDELRKRLQELMEREVDLRRSTDTHIKTLDDLSDFEKQAGEGNAALAKVFDKYKIATVRAMRNTDGLSEKSLAVIASLDSYEEALKDGVVATQKLVSFEKQQLAARKQSRANKEAVAAVQAASATGAAVSPEKVQRIFTNFAKSIAQAGLTGLPPAVAGSRVNPGTGAIGLNALLSRLGFAPSTQERSAFREGDRIRDITKRLGELVASGKSAGDVMQEFFADIIAHPEAADVFELFVSGAVQLTEAMEQNQKFGKNFVATWQAMAPQMAKMLPIFTAMRRLGVKSTQTGQTRVLAPLIGNISQLAKLHGTEFAKALRDAVTKALLGGILLRENADQIAEGMKTVAMDVAKQFGKDISLTDIFTRNIGDLAQQLAGKIDLVTEVQKVAEGALPDYGPEITRKLENVVRAVAKSWTKMDKTLAEQIRRGDHGEIGKSFIGLIDALVRMGQFGSLPEIGPIRDMGASWSLMGTTLATEMRRGLSDLKQGVTNFFTQGFGDVETLLKTGLVAPFTVAQRLIEGAILGVTGTVQQLLGGVGAVVKIVPIFGGMLSGLVNVGSRSLGLVATLATKVVGALGAVISSVIEGAINAVFRLRDAINEVAQRVTQLGLDAKRIGVNVSKLDAAQRTMQRFGVDATEATQAIATLKQNMAQAVREGSGPMAAAFENAGIALNALKELDPSEVFLRVAQALERTLPGTEEYHQLLELVGGSLSNMRAALGDVTKLQQAYSEVVKEGLVTEKDVDQALRLVRATAVIDQFFLDLRTKFFSGFTEITGKLADSFGPKAQRGMQVLVGGAYALGTVIGKLAAKIFDVVKKLSSTGGLSKIRAEAARLFEFIGGAVKVTLSGAGAWALTWLADLVDKLTEQLKPALMEAARKTIPVIGAVLTMMLKGIFDFGAKIGAVMESAVSDASLSLAAKMAGIPTVVTEAIKHQKRMEIDQSFEQFVQEGDSILDSIFKKFGVFETKTRGFADTLRSFADKNKKAFSFEEFKKQFPELAEAVASAGADMQKVFEETLAAFADFDAASAERGRALATVVEQMRQFAREGRTDITLLVELSKRANELADIVSTASEQFVIGGRAASEARREISAQLDAMSQVRNRIGGLVASVQNALAKSFVDRGATAADAKARAEAIVKNNFSAFTIAMTELVQDALSGAFAPEVIASRAAELQDSMQKLVTRVAQNLNMPPELLNLNLDLAGLFAAFAASISGVRREMSGLAEVSQRVQEFAQGFSTALLDVGVGTASLEAQYKNFALGVEAAFTKLDLLEREAGQNAVRQKEVDLQKKLVAELARQLNLEKGTKDAILARARALVDLAQKTNAATAAYNRFQAARGVVDGLLGKLGNLSDILQSVEANALDDALALKKAGAELRQMLTNAPELVSVFQKWFGVSGSIEQTVSKIEAKLQKMLQAARDIQRLQQRLETFTRLDDLFKAARDSNPFEALKNGMAEANAEAVRLNLQLAITIRENQEILTQLAENAPERLRLMARDLQESGAFKFSVDIDTASAEQLATEIGTRMREAAEKQLHNIRLRPLVERVREAISSPLVEGVGETLRAIADGTIFEAARTAREEARKIGERFSTTLHIISQLGRSIFTRAVDAFLQRLQTRLTDVVTKGITDALLSSQVFGSIKNVSEKMRETIGMVATGLVAVLGLVLSRLQSTASQVKDNIDSVVESTETVRGVISGNTNIAIKEVSEELKDAMTGTEMRLDKIIGLMLQSRGILGAPQSPLADVLLTTR